MLHRRDHRPEPGERKHLADGEQDPGRPQVRREQAQGEGWRGDEETYGRDQGVGRRPRRTRPVAYHATKPGAEPATNQDNRAIEPADCAEREVKGAAEEA